MGRRARPTKYGGVLFRSGLESRWARFFDDQRIPWRYEPAAVQIDAFRFYTPDFFLDLIDPPAIVEVKPTWEMAVDDPRISLLSEKVANICLAACGDPGPLGKGVRVYLFQEREVCAYWEKAQGSRSSLREWLLLRDTVIREVGGQL